MVLPSPLQQLCDLDQTLPQFHEQLGNLLCKREYQAIVPGLQGEDLEWLVEYLDNVGVQIHFPHSRLTIDVGPYPCVRPYKSRISGAFGRAHKGI